MGFTHYWRRSPNLNADAFQKAGADLKEVLAKLGTMGVKLAGAHGTGAVEITPEKIAFNGVRNCGHAQRDLGITWPSPAADAGGVGTKAEGAWFGGALLMERTCGGDCSHETFWIERAREEGSPDENGRFFAFCKTAYKPYDLAVTAALIILKHHLGDAIVISSDGDDKDFRDAGMICQMVLGYGADFHVVRS